jgi:hypothetical protein
MARAFAGVFALALLLAPGALATPGVPAEGAAVDRLLDGLIDNLGGGVPDPGYGAIMTGLTAVDPALARERIAFYAGRGGDCGNDPGIEQGILQTPLTFKSLWAAMTGVEGPAKCEVIGLHFHLWCGVPLPFHGREPPLGGVLDPDLEGPPGVEIDSDRQRILPWPSGAGARLLGAVLADEEEPGRELPCAFVVGALIGDEARRDESLGRALLDAAAPPGTKAAKDGTWRRRVLIAALVRWGADPAVARLRGMLCEFEAAGPKEWRAHYYCLRDIAEALRDLGREDLLREFREHLVAVGASALLEVFDLRGWVDLRRRDLIVALEERDDCSVLPELIRGFEAYPASRTGRWEEKAAAMAVGIRLCEVGTDEAWRQGEALLQAVLWPLNRQAGVSTTLEGVDHGPGGDVHWEIPLEGGAQLGGYPDPVSQAKALLRLVESGDLVPVGREGAPLNYVGRRNVPSRQEESFFHPNGVAIRGTLEGETIRLIIRNDRPKRIQVNTLVSLFGVGRFDGAVLELHCGAIFGGHWAVSRRAYRPVEPGGSLEVTIAAGPLVRRAKAVRVIWQDRDFCCTDRLEGEFLSDFAVRLDLPPPPGPKGR